MVHPSRQRVREGGGLQIRLQKHHASLGSIPTGVPTTHIPCLPMLPATANLTDK
jgi:hypothetical protein